MKIISIDEQIFSDTISPCFCLFLC